MTQPKPSLTSLASSLHLKNTLTLTLNTEFLDFNFSLIQQCLTRLAELQSRLSTDILAREQSTREINERLNYIQKDVQEQKGQLGEHGVKLREIADSLGEGLRERIEEMERGARGVHDIEKLAKQIEELNRFVSLDRFREHEARSMQEIEKVGKIKDELANFVVNVEFNEFRDHTSHGMTENAKKIDKVHENTENISKQIGEIDTKATKASQDAEQNNQMMKEINFNDMQAKLRKFKEDTDQKMNELIMKVKKKVGGNELAELEKTIVEKLDNFFANNQRTKADRDETKEALFFLEKRVNDVYEIFNTNQEGEEKDALFATRKWLCASCTKDFGKYEGKLGQFKPWSVFPCRQLDPEKTGGYGYLNYVDKMAYKKGLTVDDSGLQRLSRTFFDKKQKDNSPKKMNTTRATNFMSNYGTADKNIASLKDEYFKSGTAEKGLRPFRVKNNAGRKQSINDPEKQRIKEI